MRRMAPLLSALEPAIVPLLDRPYVFFGHSMGAVVAFELARQLRRGRRVLPERLVASGCRAPHLPERWPAIHGLPDSEFIEQVRSFGGLPDEIQRDPDLLLMLIQTLRTDLELIETWRYVPEQPLPMPIHAYGGSTDPRVTAAELRGWEEQTQGEFRMQQFPGGHFYLFPEQSQLLTALADAL